MLSFDWFKNTISYPRLSTQFLFLLGQLPNWCMFICNWFYQVSYFSSCLMQIIIIDSINLRSGSIFISLWKLYSGGQGETKREPDTNLLRNVCHPLFWLIDICRISQSELLPVLVFLVCKFFTGGKNADWLT